MQVSGFAIPVGNPVSFIVDRELYIAGYDLCTNCNQLDFSVTVAVSAGDYYFAGCDV